jgi:hypothetical protein
LRPHILKRLNAPDVGVRAALKRLRAERAAKRDHPLVVRDAGEPFAASDGFFADRALDVFDIKIAGIKVRHGFSNLVTARSLSAAEICPASPATSFSRVREPADLQKLFAHFQEIGSGS